MVMAERHRKIVEAMTDMLPAGPRSAIALPSDCCGYVFQYIDELNRCANERVLTISATRKSLGHLMDRLGVEGREYVSSHRLNVEEYCLLCCLALLKSGERLAVLLSNNLLSTCLGGDFRGTLLSEAQIDAVVSFSCVRDEIQMGCGGRSVVILRRHTDVDDGIPNNTLLLDTPDLAMPECLLVVRQFFQGERVGSDSRLDVMVRKLHGERSWLPRAISADLHFTASVDGCGHLSDYIKLVYNPRTLRQDVSTHVAENTPDGIAKSEDAVRASVRDAYVRCCNTIEEGDLLVTRQGGRFVLNVVSRDVAGMLLPPAGQTYSSAGLFADREKVRLVEVLFRSAKYCRYAALRADRSTWKEDFPNFLVPKLKTAELSHLFAIAEEEDKRLREVNEEIRNAIAEITRIYRQGLGVGRYHASELDAMPLIRLSSILIAVPHSNYVPYAGKWDRRSRIVLKNIDADNEWFDSGYLEGLLLCDFMPKSVTNVSRSFLPIRYSGFAAHNVLLPLPNRNVQCDIAEAACDALSKYKELAQRKSELKSRSRVRDFLDNHVFHENYSR